MAKTTKRKLKDQCDGLWSEIVKHNAGNKCEMCGKTTYLNSHHIFSRHNHSVRWDTSNGCALCSGHHTLRTDSAHKAPADFIEWIKAIRGIEWYESLREKAHETWKPDMEATLKILKLTKAGEK